MHFGDTAFGQLIRTLSRDQLFAHRERCIDLPSGWIEDPKNALGQHDGSYATEWAHWAARWVKGSHTVPTGNSKALDVPKEKTFDSLVGWYGDKDPDNPQNWSSAEKASVAGLICLYTFTVYLGSAIYTPSVVGVMQQFDVSYAAANLGLALFVFGCR